MSLYYICSQMLQTTINIICHAVQHGDVSSHTGRWVYSMPRKIFCEKRKISPNFLLGTSLPQPSIVDFNSQCILVFILLMCICCILIKITYLLTYYKFYRCPVMTTTMMMVRHADWRQTWGSCPGRRLQSRRDHRHTWMRRCQKWQHQHQWRRRLTDVGMNQ